MNRRTLLKKTTLAAIGTTATFTGLSAVPRPQPKKQQAASFRYCLNTSTISGQKLSLPQMIEVAAKAGYDGIEVWVRDLVAHVEQGNTLQSLKQQLKDAQLTPENAIGFATWIVPDPNERARGFRQMEEEMNMLAEIGCQRIAAPAAGVKADTNLDLFLAGERYGQLLELGRKTGVMPQLEFWGASPKFYQLGQALMVAAVANDPDVRLLPDIYHLFRGGSGFEGLKMLNGGMIELFHLNDYPGDIPRLEQQDKDRVYPGDGVAPLKSVMQDLTAMGGEKVLSLELFNRYYWRQDAALVAKTGLEKMKATVALAK